MGWSGSLTAGSAAGAAITFTPDTSGIGAYTVAAFAAPKKGVYRFDCRGSGGHHGMIDAPQTPGPGIGTGGEGGRTVYHLLMEAGQTVYVGAGGACSAAFVANVSGAGLAAIARAHIHCVAGGGGGGGAQWDGQVNSEAGGDGGHGGGASGAAGTSKMAPYGVAGGAGGTQGSGYLNGAVGGPTVYHNNNGQSNRGGRGGDGYFGGYNGNAVNAGAGGGGGGSGYVHNASITVGGTAYPSTTAQGGGAAANQNGFVQVTYVAAGELPVLFNGTRLTALYFGGTKVGSLIYNGTKLFTERVGACFARMARRFLSRRATPACSP